MQGARPCLRLPMAAVRTIFEHAEHVAALISLHATLAGCMADRQQHGVMEHAFHLVLDRTGATECLDICSCVFFSGLLLSFYSSVRFLM
jgi:hypothetical protein